jgi:serine/threonine protein kinase
MDNESSSDFLAVMSFGKYNQDFIKLNFISLGSFGIVYKAMNKKDKIFYAVKKIPFEKTNIKYILKEIEIMIKLKSHYIVEYKSSWIEQNYEDFKVPKSKDTSEDHKIFDPNCKYLFCIQMELCLKNLNEVIIQMNNELINFQTIKYYISSELSKEIVECVEFLHKQKVIHRDLKPANILITNGNNGRFIKIADFGLSVFHQYEGQLHTQCVGTMKYMAPEVKGTQKYDTKVDIYSLGVIVDELFQFKYKT